MPFQHPEHPLGTDEVGRDYLSRLIYGARTSMLVSLSVQMIALLIGLPIGALAGYFGGILDFLVSRIIDIMTAFPALLFTILIISVLGGGLSTIIVALSITSWIIIARITRAQVLTLREQEYCTAARGIGASEWRILFRHLLPNAMSPILIAVSFGIPTVIFAEAGLSFLGLGVNDPIASWGKMVARVLMSGLLASGSFQPGNCSDHVRIFLSCRWIARCLRSKQKTVPNHGIALVEVRDLKFIFLPRMVC